MTITLAPLSEAEIAELRAIQARLRFTVSERELTVGWFKDMAGAANGVDRLLSEREADKERIREVERLLGLTLIRLPDPMPAGLVLLGTIAAFLNQHRGQKA